MTIKIGTAPDNWGVWFASDERQMPWNRFLDEVVEAGYEAIELGPYGYLPTEVAVLCDALAKRNLKVTGTFLMDHFEKPERWPQIETQARLVCSLMRDVGGKYLVLIDDTYSDLFTGRRYDTPTLDDAAWQQMLSAVNRLGALAKQDYGLQAVFHPHAETHIEYEPQIERLIAGTDAALVGICIDTGHHAYRGGDPVAFIQKHHARIQYLHLKSVDPAKQKQVMDEDIPFAIAVSQDMFCEPSKGAVNFPALRDLLDRLHYTGWGIVEQDMFPAPFNKPLPIARRTRRYLRDIALG